MAHDSPNMPHKSPSESKPGSLRLQKRAVIDSGALHKLRIALSVIALCWALRDPGLDSLGLLWGIFGLS
eukprot:12429001-Karenia_brevis.AAC.1